MMLFALSLLLLVSGLVGLVRGRVDRRWVTNRRRALAMTAAGLACAFASSAPPTLAVPSPGAATQWAAPPTLAVELRRAMDGWAAVPVDLEKGIQPEQIQAFHDWEKGLTLAYRGAEDASVQTALVVEMALTGKLDRFTGWARLGVLAQDIKQADLSVRHAVPSEKLDMEHQRMLEGVLQDLHRALDKRRAAVQAAQAFLQSQRPEEVERARQAMAEAEMLQRSAAQRWAEARRVLRVPNPPPTSPSG